MSIGFLRLFDCGASLCNRICTGTSRQTSHPAHGSGHSSNLAVHERQLFSYNGSSALITRAGEELDRVLETHRIGAPVDVQKIVDVGEPVDNILQTVRKESIDLIIMGAFGRTGPDPFLVGSVTNRVLHRSPVPILIVCRPVHDFVRLSDVHPVQIKNILCAIDFERGSDAIQEAVWTWPGSTTQR